MLHSYGNNARPDADPVYAFHNEHISDSMWYLRILPDIARFAYRPVTS